MSLDPEETATAGPVVRDKRRIDPVTGEVRERPSGAAQGPIEQPTAEEQPAVTSDSASVEAELAERTADLQRLQAEYLNYKRRVDRDKDNARKHGVEVTLLGLLPVLDDIARARDHGELTGGFKAVADSLERAVEKLGLVPFGDVGDEFDPRIHEALMHSYSDEVTGPTCQAILQVGYRIDDRVLRPARVAVAEPTAVIEDASVTAGGAARTPMDADRLGDPPAGGSEESDPFQQSSDGPESNDAERASYDNDK